jgi:hypothetical protein
LVRNTGVRPKFSGLRTCAFAERILAALRNNATTPKIEEKRLRVKAKEGGDFLSFSFMFALSPTGAVKVHIVFRIVGTQYCCIAIFKVSSRNANGFGATRWFGRSNAMLAS